MYTGSLPDLNPSPTAVKQEHVCLTHTHIPKMLSIFSYLVALCHSWFLCRRELKFHRKLKRERASPVDSQSEKSRLMVSCFGSKLTSIRSSIRGRVEGTGQRRKDEDSAGRYQHSISQTICYISFSPSLALSPSSSSSHHLLSLSNYSTCQRGV